MTHHHHHYQYLDDHFYSHGDPDDSHDHTGHHHHNRRGHILYCPDDACLAGDINDGTTTAGLFEFGPADHTHGEPHVHEWDSVPDLAKHYDCGCGMRMFNNFPHLSDLWFDSLPDQERVDFALERFGPS